jgi:hypothetical protein
VFCDVLALVTYKIISRSVPSITGIVLTKLISITENNAAIVVSYMRLIAYMRSHLIAERKQGITYYAN